MKIDTFWSFYTYFRSFLGGQNGPFFGGTFKILDPKKRGVQKPAQNTGRIHVEKKELKKGQNRQKWAFFKKNHWCLVDF
jgi:hypothetical protein